MGKVWPQWISRLAMKVGPPSPAAAAWRQNSVEQPGLIGVPKGGSTASKARSDRSIELIVAE